MAISKYSRNIGESRRFQPAYGRCDAIMQNEQIFDQFPSYVAGMLKWSTLAIPITCDQSIWLAQWIPPLWIWQAKTQDQTGRIGFDSPKNLMHRTIRQDSWWQYLAANLTRLIILSGLLEMSDWLGSDSTGCHHCSPPNIFSRCRTIDKTIGQWKSYPNPEVAFQAEFNELLLF